MSSSQYIPFDVHPHRTLHPQPILPPPPHHSHSHQLPVSSKPRLPQMQIPPQQSPPQSQMLLSSSPILYSHPSQIHDSQSPPNSSQFNTLPSMPRLPPILQVEKQQVTTSATQAASASRRRNEAHFMCPVPGCGSTFTRRFNLRGTSSIVYNLPLSDKSARVCLAQAIYVLILKNDRLCASGPGVVRDLLGSMIASECDSHARVTGRPRLWCSQYPPSPPSPFPFSPLALPSSDVIKICITQKHSNTSAMAAGRPLVGLMRSMSVPGPSLYTSPSAPIFSPSTLTPFLPPAYPLLPLVASA